MKRSNEPTANNYIPAMSQTSSRKRDHVELCAREDVAFQGKTTGLERYQLTHNALPELDFHEVDTAVEFLGKPCGMPLLVSSMTGGYSDAATINQQLAEVCQTLQIPMGVGSQRQAIEDDSELESFRAARRGGPTIPLFGNLGGAEVAKSGSLETVQRLAELIDADGFAIHLNPLQELMQPEGNPNYRGVLSGIETLVRQLGLPIIVKEVGAGLSADTVRRLLEVGVRIIDVAGAGGTSWAGVELMRRSDGGDYADFWDWGIPTADAVNAARPLCDSAHATLIASGGIASPRDVGTAIALGAHLCGSARPMLKTLRESGQQGLETMLRKWQHHLRCMMFLSGSKTIADLRNAPMVRDGWSA